MEHWKPPLEKRLTALKKGDLPSRPAPAVSCQACGDRGLILVGDAACQCKCMVQKGINKQFRYANLSALIRQCTFADFDFRYYSKQMPDDSQSQISYYETVQRAFQAAQKFVRECLEGEYAKGLLFSGPVGCGKTYLAGAIANELVEQGVRLLFAVVPDLLDEIRSSYDRSVDSNNSELQLVEAARRVRVLVLDDLGAHNYTEWTRNKLYSILNFRLINSLPTIITTNLSLPELENYLGQRTTSRIVQLCRIYRMAAAQDIRLLKAAKGGDFY